MLVAVKFTDMLISLNIYWVEPVSLLLLYGDLNTSLMSH